MEITKHGKKYKPPRGGDYFPICFVCKDCKCKFEADPDEFTDDLNDWDEKYRNGKVLMSCPECGSSKTKYNDSSSDGNYAYYDDGSGSKGKD